MIASSLSVWKLEPVWWLTEPSAPPADLAALTVRQEYVPSVGQLRHLPEHVLALERQTAGPDGVQLDGLGAGVVGGVDIGVIPAVVEVGLGVGDHEGETQAVLVPCNPVDRVIEGGLQVLGAVATAIRRNRRPACAGTRRGPR